MHACCANCLSSTWIEPARPTGEIRRVACGDCAQSFVVTHARELGNTAAEHYRAMVRFAHANDIDMPCAYSVLLGVMPLAQAKAIRRSRAEGQPTPEPEAKPLPDNLDPGFHTAVREGSLTIRDALNRGNRDAFASALVNRHGLASALAFDVADNRISLRRAIRRAKAAKAAKEAEAQNITWSASRGVRDAVGGSFGQICFYMTILCGFLVLGTSVVATADGVLRRWVDVFWTAIPRLRRVDTRHISKVYFGVLCVYAICGIVLLLLAQPILLLKVSTNLYNYALGFSCWHTIAVNTILLPRELRPSLLRRTLLASGGAFFMVIAVLSTVAMLQDPVVVEFIDSVKAFFS